MVSKPLLEALVISTHIFLPKLDILVNAFLQVVTVQENQLTRHQNHTLSWITLEELIAMEQQLNQLTWIRCSRSICKLASVIECNTSLRCIRDDETHLWLLSQSHECLVLRIWIQCTADYIDTLQCIDSLAVLLTLKVYVIEAVLTVQPVNHTTSQWLNYNDRTVEVGLLVHIPYNPIYECTEEVTFTKLNDSLRSDTLRSGTLV